MRVFILNLFFDNLQRKMRGGDMSITWKANLANKTWRIKKYLFYKSLTVCVCVCVSSYSEVRPCNMENYFQKEAHGQVVSRTGMRFWHNWCVEPKQNKKWNLDCKAEAPMEVIIWGVQAIDQSSSSVYDLIWCHLTYRQLKLDMWKQSRQSLRKWQTSYFISQLLFCNFYPLSMCVAWLYSSD